MVTAEVRRRAPVPAPARLVQHAPRAPAVLTEARRPDVGPSEAACVDERADDFINNKFRQQLQQPAARKTGLARRPWRGAGAAHGRVL